MSKLSLLYKAQQSYKNIVNLHYSRFLILLLFFVVTSVVLIGKIIHLQFFEYTKYQLQSKQNRLESLPISPVRNNIYDRNGELLAGNILHYSVEVHPWSIPKQQHASVVDRLTHILSLDTAQVKQLRTYLKTRKKTAVIATNLTEEAVAHIAPQLSNVPGIQVNADFHRFYPYKQYAAHVIGYTQIPNKKDLASNSFNSLQGIKRVGRTGVELYYDKWLRGTAGSATIEQNAKGVYVREVDRVEALNGKPLYLTIDIRLQKYIADLLSPFKGSAIVMDNHNGEIIAMVSVPNFDLNVVSRHSDSTTYKTYLNDPRKPFINRSIHGTYPPGSTFKPFVALASLEHNLLNARKSFFAGPSYKPPGKSNRIFYDWRKDGHGWVNLERALAQSCDVYFYDLAYRVGIDRLNDYISQFYFGLPTGIDLPNEDSGLLPSRAWKQKEKSVRWYPGETVIFGIGQGYLLATPLQMAVNTAAIANLGYLITPKLAMGTATSHYPEPTQLQEHIPIRSIQNWLDVTKGMFSVTNQNFGSAHKVMVGATYTMAGKTGTSQVVGLSQDPEKREQQKKELPEAFQDHSLFIGFAPHKQPRITIAVIIENGGSGGSLAAPLTRDIADKYFDLYPL